MKLSRRAMLTAALGASQLALLERFGLLRDARADGSTDGPTKLLTLYTQGGTRQHYHWWPLDPAKSDTALPPPYGPDDLAFYTKDKLGQLAPGDGKFPALQMPILWDPADPGSFANGHSMFGYSWKHFALHEQTTVVHGIDQGTNAHQSAYIAAMSGAAGADYRAPALQCVVANHFLQKFADTRPLPCVAVSAQGMPQARGLPGQSGAVLAPSAASLKALLSADGTKNWWWKGLDQRHPIDLVDFSGKPTGGKIDVTDLESQVLQATRAYAGRSSAGTDAYLEGLYENYAGISRVFAKDVVSILEKIKPIEHLDDVDYLANQYNNGMFTYNFGANYAQSGLQDPLEMALRLLKSDLVTSVHAFLNEVYYDTHSGKNGHTFGAAQLRAEMDVLARMLGEMKRTPAPGKPGKTLLDDTLVMIFSEFGRSWASGPGASQPDAWSYPDDHHPITTVTFVGGGVSANRMVGSFELPQARGVEVDLYDEAGAKQTRIPRAADVTTTACRILGMNFDDFFIPGGYAEIDGVRKI
jgi:hypothetical protein